LPYFGHKSSDEDLQINIFKTKPHQDRLATPYFSIPLENTNTKVKGLQWQTLHLLRLREN